jgi:histidyl-tRNA synthetase
MKLQAIRGFNDVLPADTAVWQRLIGAARATFAEYGYQWVVLPVVESTALFKRAVGEVTDVVEKEMYSFKDRGDEDLSLRPEATAGMVRAGIEHGLLHNQQQRVWTYGSMFRYERPQAGRYRQFHQLDVEAYGIAGPDVDVEMIAMSARLWKKLGLKNLRLEINSLGAGDTRASYRNALVEYMKKHEANLDEDSQRRLTTNPLRVLDSKVPATQEVVRDAPKVIDHLDPESAAHFKKLQQGLRDVGIEFVVNPLLVRGLDYYTRTVFEWITTELGAQGTVCAGGRYDNLVEQLGGSATPAIGWASGIERLVLLMQKQSVAVPDAAPHVYVCAMGETGERAALKLAEGLREQVAGLRVVLNASGGKLKSQLARADRAGARFALILGDEEVASEAAQVKSLREDTPQTPNQTLVRWVELPDALRARLHL